MHHRQTPGEAFAPGGAGSPSCSRLVRNLGLAEPPLVTCAREFCSYEAAVSALSAPTQLASPSAFTARRQRSSKEKKKYIRKSCQNIKVRSFLLGNVPCGKANFDVKQIRKIALLQNE